jgi:hypothetical protein
MNWQEACEPPSLRNLPFKIALNEFGKNVMATVRVNHSIYQAEIAHLMLLMRSDGKAMVECAFVLAWAQKQRMWLGLRVSALSRSGTRWNASLLRRCSPPATPLRKCAKNKGCTLKQGPKKFATVMRMAA